MEKSHIWSTMKWSKTSKKIVRPGLVIFLHAVWTDITWRGLWCPIYNSVLNWYLRLALKGRKWQTANLLTNEQNYDINFFFSWENVSLDTLYPVNFTSQQGVRLMRVRLKEPMQVRLPVKVGMMKGLMRMMLKVPRRVKLSVKARAKSLRMKM